MKMPNCVMNGIGKVRKNSPEILIGIGVVSIVVATVKACKATRKLDEVLDEHKADIDDIKQEAFMPNEERRHIAQRYGKTAWELFRMYAPSVAIGGVGVCLIFKGHGILRKRYISLATTYGLLEKSYSRYRQNVIDELGEKMDRHFMYGTTEKECEIVEVDKKGKEKKVTKPVEVIELDPCEVSVPKWATSPYARVFTPKSSEWQSNSFSLSLAYARQYEEYVNNMLVARKDKPIYAEQVYDWFGFEPTEASHDVGWKYNPKMGPMGQAHFNITPFYAEIDGTVEHVILLDFDCTEVYQSAYRKEI